MRQVLHAYYRLLQVVLTLLMAALIVPVAMQVLSRYTGLVPRYIWTEEVARFCFVWIIMIGAMIAVRDGTHFDVDVLPPLPPRVEAASRLFVHLCVLAAALIFVTYGYRFAQVGAMQRSELAGLPMLSIYVAWPLAGLPWLAFLGERVAADLRRLRGGGDVGPPAPEDEEGTRRDIREAAARREGGGI
ncbi:MAG TPA: TRAP transporter small permease [Geminicoccaceae bacterium]|nr:TRAP transporter small permease [Geminicoccaceae bacterium]